MNGDKFLRGARVYHIITGGTYQVVQGPRNGVTLEATKEPAYIYEPHPAPLNGERRLWVRCAREMEDGRFKLL